MTGARAGGCGGDVGRRAEAISDSAVLPEQPVRVAPVASTATAWRVIASVDAACGRVSPTPRLPRPLPRHTAPSMLGRRPPAGDAFVPPAARRRFPGPSLPGGSRS
jgi:hypothetical protein